MPAWVLIELAKAFQDYWYDNLDGKKCTIDEKLGISQFAEEYYKAIESHKKYKLKTWEKVRHTINKEILPYIGKKR